MVPKVNRDLMCSPPSPSRSAKHLYPQDHLQGYHNVDRAAIGHQKVQYVLHLPLVFKGVSCTLPGGMKPGIIVGRTGGGRSTLTRALFRIVDLCTGQILVYGIDISTIGLNDLRTRLSVIPQDPDMFEGTLRSNIDPLHEYGDEQIWEVIDQQPRCFSLLLLVSS